MGTSAALFAAAAAPERIASVIVGTCGAAVPLELGEQLKSWVLDPASTSTAGWTRARSSTRRWTRSPAGYARRYPEELPELAELLAQITTPVTIVNGRHDRVVPVANAEFLDERLPTSRVALIDAGRFVWEEAPAEYAAIILDSITGSR